MKYRLAGISEENNQFNVTEARNGVAAKGESKIVLKTSWFDSRQERDAFVCEKYFPI